MKFNLILLLLVVGVLGLVSFVATAAESEASPSTQPLAVAADSVRYFSYTPQKFAQLAHQERVLFFRASWCGTCVTADKELSAQSNLIPANVTVFETDFDQEKDLKQKYGVVAQHTFVSVDEKGNLQRIWNGGGIEELLAHLTDLN